MNTSLAPSPSWSGRVARLALAVAVTLVLGSLMVPHADAMKKFKGKTNVSVRDRVMAQENLCTVDGGSFGMSRNAFGGTVTTCTGGSQGDWKCTNSKQSVSCTPTYTPPPPPVPGDVATLLPGGVVDAPTGGSGSTPGAGAGGIDSGGTIEPPSDPGASDGDGGGVFITASNGGAHERTTHTSKHHRHEHGKGRRK